MPVFAVTYDLNNSKDYPKLRAELERLDGHKAALSFYFIDVGNANEAQVRDHLSGFVDKDDRIIVCQCHTRPATLRAFKGTKEWLDARF